jgi:hypothetical protein
MSKRQKQFAEELTTQVRPATRNFILSVLLDIPANAAARVDFGIDSQKHYEALYYPIREAEIMPKALDAALGDGAKLTAMTREAASNPHKDVEFHTSWNLILGRESPATAAKDAFKKVLDGTSVEGEAKEQSKDQGIER